MRKVILGGNHKGSFFHNVPWLVSKLQPNVFIQRPHTSRDFGNMRAGVKVQLRVAVKTGLLLPVSRLYGSCCSVGHGHLIPCSARFLLPGDAVMCGERKMCEEIFR